MVLEDGSELTLEFGDRSEADGDQPGRHLDARQRRTHRLGGTDYTVNNIFKTDGGPAAGSGVRRPIRSPLGQRPLRGGLSVLSRRFLC